MVKAVIYQGHVNITPDEVARNVVNSLRYPQFQKGGSRGAVAICAAGPSLLDHIPLLKALSRVGVPICAVKGVARTLLEHGIVPTYCVSMDGKEGQARFFTNPHPDTEYLIAGQSHPSVFEALEGFKLTAFQCEAKHLLPKGTNYIRGAANSGLGAISVMWAKGYEHLHLIGFDCCERDGVSHVYDDHDIKPVRDYYIGAKKFQATAQMACQYTDFMGSFGRERHVDLTIYGDGMIAYAWSLLNDPACKHMSVDLTFEPVVIGQVLTIGGVDGGPLVMPPADFTTFQLQI